MLLLQVGLPNDSQDTKDLTLEITGDLSTGTWSSRASVSGRMLITKIILH